MNRQPIIQVKDLTARYGDDTILEHRLDGEGADQLLLAGVNDSNFQELARVFGIRVVLRGDQVVLSGEMEGVERAIPVAHHLIELARLLKSCRYRWTRSAGTCKRPGSFPVPVRG